MSLSPLNHKRLSSTPRKNPGTLRAGLMETVAAHTSQACPQDFFTRFHRQPPQLECLPEGPPPKARGLPSQHPGWVIAQSLLRVLSATTHKLVWRFFGSCLRTVRSGLGSSEHVVAVALRNTLPESLTTAAKTSIRVKFIWGRLDLSGTEGISLTARAARTHIAVLSSY